MKVGSLFSGYGGLDMAVGGDLAWYSEIEPAACKVMEAHHPGAPNIGDVTQVDWSEVEPVDVLTGGYPCQPFSMAGHRKGENDERHLWPHVRDAISALGPRVTILENVRGHLTLGFTSVLADLADLGLSARWGVVRASDAGAPHGRSRLFIVAYSEREGSQRFAGSGEEWSKESAAKSQKSTDSQGFGWRTQQRYATDPSGHIYAGIGDGSWSFTSDTNSIADGFGIHGGTASGAQLESVAGRYVGCDVESVAGSQVFENENGIAFGPYAQAVARWERVIGRTAPAPTVQRNQRDKLNPVFVEWMMGLPEGWVTGHGLSASQELKMLGNGVVPQQARLALELL